MWKLAIFLLFLVLCEGKLDPYRVLGVNKRASTQDIRKAYKQLAKEWHPDKNDSPDAQNKFVDINAAYELLSDPERRKKYDQHGILNNIISDVPARVYFVYRCCRSSDRDMRARHGPGA